jgi:hypothetical protein
MGSKNQNGGVGTFYVLTSSELNDSRHFFQNLRIGMKPYVKPGAILLCVETHADYTCSYLAIRVHDDGMIEAKTTDPIRCYPLKEEAGYPVLTDEQFETLRSGKGVSLLRRRAN